MITAYPYGYLHSNGNNCTGKSLGLFAYRTSKGVKLIKSTDALIHFGYTRYFHYYRIRKLLRNHLFYLCSNLCECFEFVGKRIKESQLIVTLRNLCTVKVSYRIRKNFLRHLFHLGFVLVLKINNQH